MKKVLIVDDAKDYRVILKKLLSNYEFDVIEASDGLKGWGSIIKEKPDFIILDIHMPLKDGFEILNDLEEEWLKIPVIVVSCDNSKITINSCISNGASAFLQKPILLKEFKDVINSMIA